MRLLSVLPDLRPPRQARHSRGPFKRRPDLHLLASRLVLACAFLLLAACSPAAPPDETEGETPTVEGDYQDLLALFEEWREFEPPPLREGAPDYTAATNETTRERLGEFQDRLRGIDPSGWPIPQQVDHHLVRAEMNGMRFHLDVLRPFARDPAFYASVRTYESDTPSEEGPTIHRPIRLWEYSLWPRTALDEPAPLAPDEEERLTAQLRTVPPLLEQARTNLAESDASDLWNGGIRVFDDQAGALERLRERAEEHDGGSDLMAAIGQAREATIAFAEWLRAEASSRTGPSGLGAEDYTWFLRNVLLLPLSWEDEVITTRQELGRAHASLRLEEHRNRDLPPLEPVGSAEEFARMQDRAIPEYVRFIQEEGIISPEPWMEVALRERVPSYSPPETRNFFAQATHRDPMLLWTHMYHWWDHRWMREDPHASPIRSGPLLYNVWMSRAEGLATVFEEWMMHAGLYDDRARAREIVWVMLAARAARGYASLFAHSNELTMEEAGDLHVNHTPREWMRRDLDLLGFEQHLYLRQPGYGPSYVTGGRLLEQTMRERARQLGDEFTMRRFFDELNAVGLIPVSLLHWELTGDDWMIREAMSGAEGSLMR
ncbi:MAG: hypothetical protein WD960_02865 [Gemmatimonadota bacterium]